MDSNILLNSVTKVTQTWTRQRKAEEREQQKARRRREAMVKAQRITVADAAYYVMEKAYLKASSNNTLPAHARQIMYAARGEIQRLTGKKLNDQYFTQTLLPDYLTAYPEKALEWDVVFDARGHFTEPHTAIEVPLGTLAVRDYLLTTQGKSAKDQAPTPQQLVTRYPTQGPENRYSAVLFIEKEGFMPLFHRVKLAERFDMAIMSTKGMSVTAARLLIDELCGEFGIPLLILRDFDKAGFSIAGTLQRDTRRYAFRNAFEGVGLGLRLEDVENCGLESEEVVYGKSDPTSNLVENDATAEEVKFLLKGWGDGEYWGHRVELNAFPSQDLVDWIEGKLEAAGVKKVIPEKETLEDAYREAFMRREFEKASAELLKQAREEAKGIKVPESMINQVKDLLEKNPKLSWDMALENIVWRLPHEH